MTSDSIDDEAAVTRMTNHIHELLVLVSTLKSNGTLLSSINCGLDKPVLRALTLRCISAMNPIDRPQFIKRIAELALQCTKELEDIAGLLVFFDLALVECELENVAALLLGSNDRDDTYEVMTRLHYFGSRLRSVKLTRYAEELKNKWGF